MFQPRRFRVPIAILILYVSAYISLSRCGMNGYDIVGFEARIWTFDPALLNVGATHQGRPSQMADHRRERFLYRFFFPLVRLDAIFLGNIHALDFERNCCYGGCNDG